MAGVKGRRLACDIEQVGVREYVSAQGGREEGLAVLQATRSGGRFSDYKKRLRRYPRTEISC
ncbi:MAG: hypothetical protein R3A47_04675 [Polyangiales bacterium]